ncbi:MAG TPA: three-Cys-motif partner protein TcmP, partial [Armatimonadota bacterium]|nr:three-Cys-motif partner protein TcmP [Armatimonadota bacterium]
MRGDFFSKQSKSSRCKADIVSKYFNAWAIIIASNPRVTKLAYIDLFAGPGIYEDSSKSTPILILEQAIQKPELRCCLITLFNDKHIETVKRLEASINAIPDIEQLKYKPVFHEKEVDSSLIEMFKSRRLPPTLLFIDPWGFKGLSIDLIGSVLKDWGSDCIFFFNYNEVNRWIDAPKAGPLIDDIFGAEEAELLRSELRPLDPIKREERILAGLEQALKKIKGNYVLRFRFKEEDKDRTSHYLIFVTKHKRGYDVMKEIMAKASSWTDDGVASFVFDPLHDASQGVLLQIPRRDLLGDELLSKFAGCSLTVQEVYDKHNIGTPYIIADYKDALQRLEDRFKIAIDPP